VEQDTSITTDNATPWGAEKRLYILQNGGSTSVWSTLMQFDLSVIPLGSQVVSAKARLYVRATDSTPINVHRVTAAWDERVATWAAVGSHYDPLPTTSFVPAGRDQATQVDLTSLAQDWLAGVAPNHGILLETPLPSSDHTLASKEESDGAQWPYLEVLVANPRLMTIKDDFDPNTGYAGSDGNRPWRGPWMEIAEADGPAIGQVQARIDDKCGVAACLQVAGLRRDAIRYGAQRGADLAGAVSAALSFTFRTTERSGRVDLEISSDGGQQWSRLRSYGAAVVASSHVSQTFNILPFVSPDTRIRFIASGDPSDLWVYVDDVQLAIVRQGIAGRVWGDVNRDAMLNAGEAGLPGVALALYAGACASATSVPYRAAATTNEGKYIFAQLPAGDYCVRPDRLTLPISATLTTSSPALDVTLTADKFISTIDFGYALTESPDRLNVGAFAPCTDPVWLRQLAQDYHTTLVAENPAACLFTASGAAADIAALQAAVAAHPNSRHVALDALARGDFTPDDPDFSNPSRVYGPQQIHAPAAWDVTLGDPNLIIAIVDTGVDPNHPEFAGRLLPGYDFVNNDADPRDDNGHGTHVAGIAAAAINNATGIAGIAGTAQILPVKVLNASNVGTWSQIAQGITYAVDHGAKIINLSLGGATYSAAIVDALNYALSHNVTVVAAAGNDSTAEVRYPASLDQVLALGATTVDGVRWSLSNYGQNVDAMAPGATLYSTYWASTTGSGYRFMSGTSMAAPHGAGLAALVLTVNPSLSPAQVKDLLQSTAADLGDPGVDALHGYGLLNAEAALAATPAGAAITPTTSLAATLAHDANANGLVEPGDTVRYLVTVVNPGAVALNAVVVSAAAPAATNYVPDSTRLNGIPARDDAAPQTALPLDEAGLAIGGLPPYGRAVVSFDVTVGQPPRGVYTIVGEATVTAESCQEDLQVVTPVAGTLLQAAVSQPSAQISQTLTYTFTSDYLGGELLNNVVITAAVPAGTSYVAGSAVAGGTESGGVVTWNLGSTAAVGVDRVNSHTFTPAASMSAMRTVSGTERLLLVGAACKTSSVNYVRYNGVYLTRMGLSVRANARVEIWSLVAPAAGVYPLEISLSGSDYCSIGSASFTGVDQVNPLGAFVAASGLGSTASVTANAAQDELVFDTVAFTSAPTLTWGAGQTQLWNAGAGGVIVGAGSSAPGAASVDMSWSASASADWAIGAIPVRPAKGNAITSSVPQSETFSAAGLHTWIAPSGVTSITVEAWGGGGAGASATHNNGGSAGGGGGAYARSVMSVTPGQSYSLTVGGGGVSSATAPVQGGDSWFGAATILLARGGATQANNQAAGAQGGQAATSIGDVKYSGGWGASGNQVSGGRAGGGGGSSAGLDAAGNLLAQGTVASTGQTAPTGGGAGGDGATVDGDGGAGGAPGGGGGGARKTGGKTTHLGGDGAPGQIRISYTRATLGNALSAAPTLVTSGGLITVTQVLTADLSLASGTLDVRIAASSDDAEEAGPDATGSHSPGDMYPTSSDLELTTDNDTSAGYSDGTQKIGLRFNNLNVPQGASITNASLIFRAVAADSPNTNDGATNLTIRGQAADNPTTFTGAAWNITNRITTTASVAWSPAAWTAGVDYSTPDLSAVVQEIVNRPGWASGNSMVFIIAGSGSRSADSHDGSPSTAPLLHIEWELTPAPTVPGPLTITGTNGVTAIWVSGPTPASATVGISGATFTWVYRTTGSNIGQLTFRGGATGGGYTWPAAQANSVIVHPPLTFGATVTGAPADGGPIRATGFIRAANGATPPLPAASNTPTTGLLGSIGDRIWHDHDGDAIQDGGESGLAGVTVRLTDADGGLRSAVTDADGRYAFTGLLAGVYTVTLDAAAIPPELDTLTTRYPVVAPLRDGEVFTAADVGLKGRSIAVGDMLWYDADADGLQDAGEPGIGNVTLDLYFDDGDNAFNPTLDTLVDTTTSDATGAYRLNAPVAGVYFVNVTDQAGILTGLQHTLGPQSRTDPSPAIVLGLGQFEHDVDFAYVQVPQPGNAIIGDLVWADANANGLREVYEPVLIGVQVCAAPTAGGASICGLTDSNGRYRLDVPAAAYNVAPSGQGLPAGLLPATPYPLTANLTPGQQQLDADFGFAAGSVPLGGIGGVVWQDLPAGDMTDGVYNPAAEPGIPEVSVGLIRDVNGDGSWNGHEPYIAAFSTISGDYAFVGLPSGAYLVRVTDTRRILRRFAVSTPGPLASAGADHQNKPQPYAVVLAPGGVDTTADFGYREYEAFGYNDPPPPGMIGDLVWLDADADGQYDPIHGDLPLPGVTLAARNAAGAIVAATTTGSDGKYLFTDLIEGDYTVEVSDAFGVLLASLIPTVPSPSPAQDNTNRPQPYAVTLGLDPVNFHADFGYTRPATLAGVIYYDRNGNGVRDAGEMLVAERVDITLTDLAAGLTRSAAASGGSYTFMGLLPGSYQLSAPPIIAGALLSGDAAVTVMVEVGGAAGADFGYVAPTAVSLAGFTALPGRTAVQLAWQVTPLAGAGAPPHFHVWRQAAAGADWQRLTTTPVEPATPDGQTLDYVYRDAQIVEGATCLYRLEAEDGSVFGPWAVRTQGPAVFLPALRR
jgi:uncharacterized repeat protein (TIGR01451 family)